MAIKFETNIPLTLRFPYGDAKEVNGQYGLQFMYTVEVEGLRDRLYATPGLHHKLQEAGIRAGVVVTITKIEVEGNRKDWRVEIPGRNGLAVLPASKHLNGEAAAANGHPTGHQDEPEGETEGERPALETAEFEQLRRTLQHCLSASYGAWEKLEAELPYTSEDVRAVGITLFLECARKGIVPTAKAEEEEGVPF